MKMSYYSAYNLEKYNMSSLDSIHHSEANLKLGGKNQLPTILLLHNFSIQHGHPWGGRCQLH